MANLRTVGSSSYGLDPNADFGPQFEAEQQLRSLNLARLWATVLRRRKLFLAVAIGLFVLVAAFSILQKSKYTTNVRLIAGSANSDSSAIQSSNAGGTPVSILNAMLAAKGTQTPETYVDLLLQPQIAQEVAKKLHLAASDGQVLAAVKAHPVPDTAIISLSVTWSDRETSAAIANAWAQAFTEHETQLIGQQADALLATTRAQLPDAEQRVSAAQDELTQYQQDAHIADLPTQTTTIITNEQALETKLQTAILEGQQAQATLATVQSSLASTPETITGSSSRAPNPVKQSGATELARLKGLLAQARQQYTDAMPTVIQLRAQVAEAQRAYDAAPDNIDSGTSTIPNPVYQQLQTQEAQLTAQIASSQAQVETLNQQISAAKPAVEELPAKARRIGALEQNLKAAQDYLTGLQEKNKDAVIAKSTAISDVSVTQGADPSTATVAPNRVLNIVIGLVLGIALGLVAVFIAEFIDDRFRTADDIRDRLGLPLLGTIPAFDAASVARNKWIKPLSSESFHQLVASLRYASDDPPRTITFTSPDRGDGKSTVVYNTALSMGLMGQRVLVIDGDLRRPTMHAKFGIGNERGLVDVLVGLAKLEDVIRPTDNPDVFVLTAGRPVPNPLGLLQSEAFDRVLRDAASRFKQVLVDGPALLPIVDGLILAHKTDGVVLVVSAVASNGRSVSAALEKIRGLGSINLLGVVLNSTTPSKREFSPYYLGAGQTMVLPGGAD